MSGISPGSMSPSWWGPLPDLAPPMRTGNTGAGLTVTQERGQPARVNRRARRRSRRRKKGGTPTPLRREMGMLNRDAASAATTAPCPDPPLGARPRTGHHSKGTRVKISPSPRCHRPLRWEGSWGLGGAMQDQAQGQLWVVFPIGEVLCLTGGCFAPPNRHEGFPPVRDLHREPLDSGLVVPKAGGALCRVGAPMPWTGNPGGSGMMGGGQRG